jgi:hypothetical protein
MSTLDVVGEYEASRQRVVGLVAPLDDHGLDAVVPACDLWRVRDVVAHLTGVLDDLLAGNTAGAAGDEWTGAQVEARRGRQIDDVVAEWDRLWPVMRDRMAAAPDQFFFMLADVVSHEHDLRGAIGIEGDREAAAVVALADRFMGAAATRVTDAGLPPLDDAVTPPNAFEALRAATGRRSRDQIAAWDWRVDPAPYLPMVPTFPARPTPLVE